MMAPVNSGEVRTRSKIFLLPLVAAASAMLSCNASAQNNVRDWEYIGVEHAGTNAAAYTARTSVGDDSLSFIYFPADDTFVFWFAYNGDVSFSYKNADRAEVFIRTNHKLDMSGRYDSDYVVKGKTLAQPDANPHKTQFVIAKLTNEDIQAMRAHEGYVMGVGYFVSGEQWRTYTFPAKGLWAAMAKVAQAANVADKFASSERTATAKNVYARIGGRDITEDHVRAALAQYTRQPPFDAVLDEVVRFWLVSIAAETAGLGDRSELATANEFLRRKALHNAYIEEILRPQITNELVRARYDEKARLFRPQPEIRARHILVKTFDEAKVIIKALDVGADFVKLAAQTSIGPSKQNGGDLGYFTAGMMVPAFEKAAFALANGEYSKEPVRTQFGFHIIKVEDRRMSRMPAFEQEAEKIRLALLREMYQARITEFRNAYGVQLVRTSAPKAKVLENAQLSPPDPGSRIATATPADKNKPSAASSCFTPSNHHVQRPALQKILKSSAERAVAVRSAIKKSGREAYDPLEYIWGAVPILQRNFSSGGWTEYFYVVERIVFPKPTKCVEGDFFYSSVEAFAEGTVAYGNKRARDKLNLKLAPDWKERIVRYQDN